MHNLNIHGMRNTFLPSGRGGFTLSVQGQVSLHHDANAFLSIRKGTSTFDIYILRPQRRTYRSAICKSGVGHPILVKFGPGHMVSADQQAIDRATRISSSRSSGPRT